MITTGTQLHHNLFSRKLSQCAQHQWPYGLFTMIASVVHWTKPGIHTPDLTRFCPSRLLLRADDSLGESGHLVANINMIVNRRPCCHYTEHILCNDRGNTDLSSRRSVGVLYHKPSPRESDTDASQPLPPAES